MKFLKMPNGTYRGNVGLHAEKTHSKSCLIGLLFVYLLSMNRKRELLFFKDYFERFFDNQTLKVQKKILWTLRIIEELEQIPEIYLKYLKNTSGLYEIRVQVGNNIFRIFCFFDKDNIVVIGHGFKKKSQKIPKKEIERAEQIKREYYDNKE